MKSRQNKGQKVDKNIPKLMAPFRKRIDRLDDRIIDLLVVRYGIIREVGHFKTKNGIPAVIASRVLQVRERCVRRAKLKGIDHLTIRKVYDLLIKSACRTEQGIIAKGKKKRG